MNSCDLDNEIMSYRELVKFYIEEAEKRVQASLQEIADKHAKIVKEKADEAKQKLVEAQKAAEEIWFNARRELDKACTEELSEHFAITTSSFKAVSGLKENKQLKEVFSRIQQAKAKIRAIDEFSKKRFDKVPQFDCALKMFGDAVGAAWEVLQKKLEMPFGGIVEEYKTMPVVMFPSDGDYVGARVVHRGNSLAFEPIFLNPDKLNVVFYDTSGKDARVYKTVSALVSNFLYQEMLRSLSRNGFKIRVFSPDSAFSDWDKFLNSQVGTDLFTKKEDINEFCRTMTDLASRGPNSAPLVVVVFVPEGDNGLRHGFELLLKTIYMAAVNQVNNVHSLIIAPKGRRTELEKYKGDRGDNLLAPQGNEDRYMVAVTEISDSKDYKFTQWDSVAELKEVQFKRYTLQMLAHPPQKTGTASLAVKIGNRYGFPYKIVFDTQNNSTIYVNGLPGSGKSTFLSDFILDMAENYSPDEVRFVITVFDDKGADDFGKIAELPHVSVCYFNGAPAMFSVILDAVRHEAKVRGEIISRKLGVGNNLGVYKEKCAANGWEKIPYLFWIVDEASLLGRMEAEKKRDLECIVKLARSRGIFFLFANQNKENQADGVMASLCDLLSYNLRLEEENGIYRRVLKRMNTASAYGDGDRLDEISGEMSQTEVADVRNSRVDAILKKWKTHLPGSRTWLKTSLPTKDDVPDAVDRFKGAMVSSPKDVIRIVVGMTLSKVEERNVVKTYKDTCIFDFSAALGRNLVCLDDGKATRLAFLKSVAASLELERKQGKAVRVSAIDLDFRCDVGNVFKSFGACACDKRQAVEVLREWHRNGGDGSHLLIVNCTSLKDKIDANGEFCEHNAILGDAPVGSSEKPAQFPSGKVTRSLETLDKISADMLGKVNAIVEQERDKGGNSDVDFTQFANALSIAIRDGATNRRFLLLVGRESRDFLGMQSLMATSTAFSLARISPGSLEDPFSCFRKSNDEGEELKFGGRLYETLSRGAAFEAFIPFDVSVPKEAINL
jgi:hypothetical protein